MASRKILYVLPQHLISAIRKADVLTGEFLRPVSAEAVAELEGIGLASVAEGALTDEGMAIRFWLMSGTERAPCEVSRLLEEMRSWLRPGPERTDAVLSLEMTATPSLLPIPLEIEPGRMARANRADRRAGGEADVRHH